MLPNFHRPLNTSPVEKLRRVTATSIEAIGKAFTYLLPGEDRVRNQILMSIGHSLDSAAICITVDTELANEFMIGAERLLRYVERRSRRCIYRAADLYTKDRQQEVLQHLSLALGMLEDVTIPNVDGPFYDVPPSGTPETTTSAPDPLITTPVAESEQPKRARSHKPTPYPGLD